MGKRAIALLLLLLLGGCAADRDDDTPHRRTVLAMDTVMSLTAYGGKGERALDAAEAELYRLDALLARGSEGSAVYALNHGESPRSEEVADLLAAAETIRDKTGGAFDPYLGAVLDLWGFGSGAGEHRVPTARELAEAPRLLDLGGIAKGYAGERVQAVFVKNGVQSAVLDLGGDVSLLGWKPDGSAWHIAVKDPADTGKYLGVLETEGDCFIMTSGVYERYFEENGLRYHHILDPKTGYPAESGLVSATVICSSGLWADALATAVSVMGAEEALALRERMAEELPFDLILVTEDNRVLCTSPGFTAEAGNRYTYERIG